MLNNKYPVLTKHFGGKKLLYFDAACTYLRHQDFIDAAGRYYTEYSSCAGDRESSYLGSLLSEDITNVRKNIKKFIGAKMDDHIIFTASTTDAVNMIAHGIIDSIDTIIVSDLEHNSNYLPWYHIAQEYKKECRCISYQDIFDSDRLRSILQEVKGPFLIAITHASNILGGIFDIASVARIVHEFGGYILVDDAQYIVHHRENVIENDIDFLVFSGHKLGGPTGIGVLYIKHTVTHLITKSIHLGGGTVRKIVGGIPEYKKLPEFLEGGVQNFAAILGLGFIIEERLVTIESESSEYIQDLIGYFHTQFTELGYSKYMTIISLKQGSIITLRPITFHAIDFHQYCNYFLPEYIISFRTGSFCADNYVNMYLNGEKNIMRFSFGVYNTKNDIDILFSSLYDYLGLQKK